MPAALCSASIEGPLPRGRKVAFRMSAMDGMEMDRLLYLNDPIVILFAWSDQWMVIMSHCE